MKTIGRFLVVFASVGVLSACGSGGGGESGDVLGATDTKTTDTKKDTTTTDTGKTDTKTNDTTVTDPGTTDPGESDPGTTDPGTADPGATDPGTTDPGATDPGTTDPGTADPGATDPGTTDPGSVSTCAGACSAESSACMANGTSVCFCDTEAGELAEIGCAEACEYYGGTGTQCAVKDGVADCDCTFDCNDSAAVESQCGNEIYTPCTCAAANPCSWIGDEYCDSEACNEMFPNQTNLDDSADCG